MIAIGTLSARTGVKVETIRYYERIGLLPKAERQQNGRRHYSEVDLRRLSFIRNARKMDFDTRSIAEMLRAQRDLATPCNKVSDIAITQLAAIEDKINTLVALRHELSQLVFRCNNERVAECSIIVGIGFRNIAEPA
jgi:DNA-binding transcriptional MerR regulator